VVHDDYKAVSDCNFNHINDIHNICKYSGGSVTLGKVQFGKKFYHHLAVFSPLKLRLKLNEEIKEFLIDPLGVKVFNNFFSSSLFLPPKIS
jgi:hypothetical protein